MDFFTFYEGIKTDCRKLSRQKSLGYGMLRKKQVNARTAKPGTAWDGRLSKGPLQDRAVLCCHGRNDAG